MIAVLIGALIEAAGIVFLVIGGSQQGFPPGPMWLVPAIVLIVIGNGLVVYSIFSKAMAQKKKDKPGS